ncbi:MAG: hypothetical protein ABIA67_05805, partial [Candidatus Margulisiibacteriota bacterium]
SRFLDGEFMNSKKGIRSYVNFFSMLNMDEDFADQYALFKTHPEVFDHFASQDDVLRQNLAFFRSLEGAI